MLQYVLTALAGLALGIVGMRIWQAREPADASLKGEAKAAPAIGARVAGAGVSSRKLLYGAGALVAVAIAVFALRPAGNDAPAVDSTALPPAPGGQNLDDVDTMITRLADRLAKNPNDGEGFRMLGWSYVMTGHPEKAIEPYKRALALLPGSAIVHSGFGEAQVGVAGGKVTDEARAAFEKAVALDPAEPRARYFLALWQAQHGEEEAALDKWIALANSGPADAPWQTDVRRQIDQTSTKLGIDIAGRLKAVPSGAPAIEGAAQVPVPDPSAMQAAGAMPAQERQAMIDRMVEGLAAKLKANPGDADGWARLLRSRMVLKQSDQAGKDLAVARKALAEDKPGLARVNSAAAELGVPGA